MVCYNIKEFHECTTAHGGIAQLGAQTVQQRTPQQQVHKGLCVNLQHLGV